MAMAFIELGRFDEAFVAATEAEEVPSEMAGLSSFGATAPSRFDVFSANIRAASLGRHPTQGR
jgi:hypothetical protein